MLKTIETERLLLREFRPEDAEPFFEFLGDRDCCYFDGGYEPVKSAKSRLYKKYMELFSYQTQERYMIELKAEHRCIGTIHLMEAEERKVPAMEVGYGICPSYQKKGYATEAVRAAIRFCFEELGMELLTAKVMEPNKASLRLIEKLGFVQEGIIKKGAKYPPLGAVDYLCFYMEAQD